MERGEGWLAESMAHDCVGGDAGCSALVRFHEHHSSRRNACGDRLPTRPGRLERETNTRRRGCSRGMCTRRARQPVNGRLAGRLPCPLRGLLLPCSGRIHPSSTRSRRAHSSQRQGRPALSLAAARHPCLRQTDRQTPNSLRSVPSFDATKYCSPVAVAAHSEPI